MKLLFSQFFLPSWYFLSLEAKYCLQHPALKHIFMCTNIIFDKLVACTVTKCSAVPDFNVKNSARWMFGELH
jgi:hypothetical protein